VVKKSPFSGRRPVLVGSGRDEGGGKRRGKKGKEEGEGERSEQRWYLRYHRESEINITTYYYS